MEAEGLGAETRPRAPMSRCGETGLPCQRQPPVYTSKAPAATTQLWALKQGQLRAAVSPGDSRGQGVPGGRPGGGRAAVGGEGRWASTLHTACRLLGARFTGEDIEAQSPAQAHTRAGGRSGSRLESALLWGGDPHPGTQSRGHSSGIAEPREGLTSTLHPPGT